MDGPRLAMRRIRHRRDTTRSFPDQDSLGSDKEVPIAMDKDGSASRPGAVDRARISGQDHGAMPAATIRPARPEEASALAALVERAYTHYVPVIGRRPAPMEDDYSARIAAGQAFVLERAGSIVGLAVLEDAPDHLYVDNIAVEPAHQGEGLGRALLAFAEDEARRRGLATLRLHTNERMERNIALYARIGYAEEERREEDGFRRVFMAKRLA